ncbi:Mth938-like domain-containing protein [Paracoccus sp. AK26]|uniref:Mth938-like domain-containing protein n=1 Tax=Paracoccus sp. AK26 TaxID=2589076 RepID=UPI0014285FF0|nr:Mth938-like domain-containing protein [Paracoccus sp. AK26]QIR84502.1 hypothetical protein FIU66_04330 [Paracoccus sp. AK26]
MKLTPSDFGGALAVEGYGPGFFRIGRTVMQGAVLVTAGEADAWGGLDDRAALLALGGRIDVLFLGMGADVAHAPADLVAALREVGIAVESMSSPTAARSYNVTVAEGRRVACALLPL